MSWSQRGVGTMEIKISRNVRVSRNYLWHEIDDQFEDLRTRARQSNSYLAKVDVYEDRVRTWFLDWAANLVHTDQVDDGVSPGDYVALSVALAYIEGVQQYRLGGKSSLGSEALFTASAKRILPAESHESLPRPRFHVEPFRRRLIPGFSLSVAF